MRRLYPILLFLSSTLHAQDQPPVTLEIGDPAPPLQLRAWLKGDPVQSLQKGQVYVIEFWAVWCAPCRAAIPHLSKTAAKYKGKITLFGVDVMEQGINSPEKVKAFVESMGPKMNYAVAAEDSNFMTTNWLRAMGAGGIPTTIIVNADGILAWAGHPSALEKVLPQVLKNKWDIQKEAAKRRQERYLDSVGEQAYYRLLIYRDKGQSPDDFGKPDLALIAINSILINEPLLKFSPRLAYQTFTALLATDQQKALEYGREAIVTPAYDWPPTNAIIAGIEAYSDRLKLIPEIYNLGAEACQRQIERIPWPEDWDLQKYYSKMADMYVRANQKSKAVNAQQKAIQALKTKKDFSAEDLETLQSRLQEIKRL